MSPSNPARIAIALRHEPEGASAPRVVARGEGLLADAIVDAARKQGVEVRGDAGLAELLRQCEIGQEISPELFEPVARLLVRLYRWNEELATAGRERARS